MTPRVRTPFNTRPRLVKSRHGKARRHAGCRGTSADLVVDRPVDAVIGDEIPGAERVGVVGERAGGDATVLAAAVAAEAVGWVEEDGGLEFPCVTLFGPVSGGC